MGTKLVRRKIPAVVEETLEEEVETVANQLDKQRRSVDFDTYDLAIQQLLTMVDQDDIDIAPVYQRQFRWDLERCSQLIESFFLGIPVPSLFMATNSDATWELVDGVQRISTLVKFCGSDALRKKLDLGPALKLAQLEKLDQFNGYTFKDLPKSLQRQFELRPVKVVTLSDKSDKIVRFDLFERLNRGGVTLTPQEIRSCVFRGPFAEFLEAMAKDQNFLRVVKLNRRQIEDGTREECVLRFFAFLNRYQSFTHYVDQFLNKYMERAGKKFDFVEGESVFRNTFLQLATVLPNGIVRPTRRGVTPLILFEGVAVGAALALQESKRLHGQGAAKWIGSQELRETTTGFTNSPAAVRGRIEFCRDKFLGK